MIIEISRFIYKDIGKHIQNAKPTKQLFIKRKIHIVNPNCPEYKLKLVE